MLWVCVLCFLTVVKAELVPVLKNEDPIPNQYIVVLKSDVDVTTFVDQVTSSLPTSPRAGHLLRRIIDGKLLKAAIFDLNDENLEKVRRLPGVKYIEEDGHYYIAKAAKSWGLDRIDQRSGTNGYFTLNSWGANQEIYVIDTGILPTHTEFENRGTAYYDAYTKGGNGIDCHGHGTHCAGTAAGKNYGVAAEAKVFGVRVFGCSGSGSLSTILDGISHVADTTVGKNVILSMSIGGSYSQTMNDLIDQVVAQGDVVVVAAGNEFQDACRKSPSSAPSAITVGATEKVNDRKAAYSNHGPCVNIFAPGSSIKSAWIGSDTATATISGTSMAAPHVSGAAAVLMEQGYASDEVLPYLLQTATKYAIDLGNLGADDSPNLLLYVE